MDDGINRPDWGSDAPVEVVVGNFGDGIDRPDWNSTAPAVELPARSEQVQQSDADSNPFQEQDATGIQAAAAALQETWGNDVAKNLDSVRGLLASAPKHFKEAMLSARYNDDRAIANDPAVLTWLASLVPQAGKQSDSEPDLHAEIALIESKMGTREYIKNESMQARLRSLYAARGD